ncbi:MAG: type VI secretion system tip protein VgrG [Desulforhopalus sp.]
MDPAVHQSQIGFHVGGNGFSVLGLTGTEFFNQPFDFQVTVLAESSMSPASLMGASARIDMAAPDGFQRRVNGIVTSGKVQGAAADGQIILQLTVQSILATLHQRVDSRLIISQTLPEIIEQTLKRNGVPKSILRFNWVNPQHVRPSTLQAQENDLDFLWRLANRQGILAWSESTGSDEILHFTDTTNYLPRIKREILSYLPPVGLASTTEGTTRTGILKITVGATLTANTFAVHDVYEDRPDEHLTGERSLLPSCPTERNSQSVTFGSGVKSLDQAEDEARIQAQRAACKRMFVEITSNAADLQVGAFVQIDVDAYGADLSGDYLISSISHELYQYGDYAREGFSGVKDCAYTNRATLIPRETPWRPELPPRRALPLTFTARIESIDSTANLDEAGRYRYRQHPDSNCSSKGEASQGVRQLQPYTTPCTSAGPLPAGWHMPLLDNNEVLISCLNNDPDRPMIVGTLANPENPSPVNSDNPHQNLIRTAAGNEICFDDLVDKEAISLCTFAGQNMLHLNADVVGHRINLASGEGLVECYAKKTIKTEVGDSLTETVGNDRVQTIENRHSTTTNSKEIHYQAETDGRLASGNNIHLKAGKNIELKAEKTLSLDITESSRITVDDQSASINIDSGSLTIDAENGLLIKGNGGGTITFAQNGAGFSMAPNGDITLFGKNIVFNTPGGVNLNGRINMDITCPPGVSLPSAVAPLAVNAIRELIPPEDKEDGKAVKSAWEFHIADLFDNQVDTTTPLWIGLPWVLETDSGEVYEGIVEEGGIIRMAEVEMRKTCTLTIDQFNFDFDLDAKEDRNDG